jgi:L-threonylcarbamoyladenylate synthase
MHVFTDISDPKVSSLLEEGAIGVIRTDTLYGLICRVSDEAAVQRIYELKGRDDHKSPIVLIANQSQLFDEPSDAEKTYLDTVWPGPVSVIVPSIHAPKWIRRENDSVAYRLPNNQKLVALIEVAGPLIAPSANPQGEPVAMSIDDAKSYFDDAVNFYVDEGMVENVQPSQLVRILSNGTIERLR